MAIHPNKYIYINRRERGRELRADSGLYCGESIKEGGMIDNRVQLMGCKRGRPRPSASLLTAILRGCYIYLIRGRAEVGSRRLLHELLFLLADQMGYPLLSPIGERYGPIVAERKWAVFTPVGVNTIHTSHSSFQRSGIKGRGPSSSEDDSYGLLVQTGRTTFVETESIDGIIFRDPRRISSDSTNPSLLLII